MFRKYLLASALLGTLGVLISLQGCGDDNSATTDNDTDSSNSSDSDADGGSEEDTEENTEEDTATEAESACEPGESYNPTTQRCVDCSRFACDLDGEDGINDLTTVSGQCICATEPGYFYSMSELKAAICDADQDGWVSIVAKQFIEGDDQALKDNANCYLRTIDKIVLEPDNDLLDTVIVTIEPLPLYEASGRDVDSVLALDTNAPKYGARKLAANELNSFTKACVTSIADYNANEVPDIEEWEEHEDLAADFAPYAEYAYYLELHLGWYEASGADDEFGAYHIAERSRLAETDSANRVPLNSYVNNEDQSYWRQCLRHQDAAYDHRDPAIGFDFAWANNNDDAQMFHHSEFKCVQALAPGDQLNLKEAPHLLDQKELGKFVLNSCESVSSAPPVDFDEDDSASFNPGRSQLSCEELKTAETGDVAFGLVRYANYLTRETYTRGCVNECVDYDVWPGLEECTGEADCDTDKQDFGAGICGCFGNYSFPTCVNCQGNWDISSACETCLGNWDVDEQCDLCIEGWEFDTSCTSCANNWDTATNCTTCTGNWDEQSNCETCYSDPMFGHWTGDDCGECAGHWNINDDCLSCTNRWVNDNDDCGSCPDSDQLGHWNPEDDCKSCTFRSQTEIDPDSNYLDYGFWDMGDECKSCVDLWTQSPGSCSVCDTIKYNWNVDDNKCERTKTVLLNGTGSSGTTSWEHGAIESDLVAVPSGQCGTTAIPTSTASGPNFFTMQNMVGQYILQNVNLSTHSNEIKPPQKLTQIYFGGSYLTCDSTDLARFEVSQFTDSTNLEQDCTSGNLTSTQVWSTNMYSCPINPAANKLEFRLVSKGSTHNVFYDDLEIYLAVD